MLENAITSLGVGCYLVKEGTYVGSAILVLVTMCSVNGLAFSTLKCSQANQHQHTKIQKKKKNYNVYPILWEVWLIHQQVASSTKIEFILLNKVLSGD